MPGDMPKGDPELAFFAGYCFGKLQAMPRKHSFNFQLMYKTREHADWLHSFIHHRFGFNADKMWWSDKFERGSFTYRSLKAMVLMEAIRPFLKGTHWDERIGEYLERYDPETGRSKLVSARWEPATADEEPLALPEEVVIKIPWER